MWRRVPRCDAGSLCEPRGGGVAFSEECRYTCDAGGAFNPGRNQQLAGRLLPNQSEVEFLLNNQPIGKHFFT